MGRKRSGRRKYFHICIAILIIFSPLACTFDQLMNTKMVDASGEEARAHLALGWKFFTEGNFAKALTENEKVLSLAGRNPPTDKALFSIGLIHAYPDNPSMDYGKSLIALGKLIKDYPGSPLVQQAKIILGLIRDNDNFTRRVERLNHTIDVRQKTVTVHEAKMGEQAKTIAVLTQKNASDSRKITDLTQENEKLGHTIEKLNTIINELKKVDIDVDQKKRGKAK